MLQSPRHFWLGMAVGLLGLLFYANFRQTEILFDLIPAYGWLKFTPEPFVLPIWLSEWIPSFLHVIGMSLFSAGFFGTSGKRYWQIPISWLLIDLVFEVMQAGGAQGLLSHGHFEWVDLLAMVAGAGVSIRLLKPLTSVESEESAPRHAPMAAATALGVGAFMMLGSYVQEDTTALATDQCTYPDESVTICAIEPIYLDWELWRAAPLLSFSAENANQTTQPFIDQGAEISEYHGLENPGRIYSYQGLLLIVSQLKGVYLFDNRDRANPTYLGFLNLLGTADVAVSEGYLYVTAFTDVLVINLNDLTQVERNSDLLPYPYPDLWIPEGTLFANLIDGVDDEYERTSIDQSRGVVIGYRNKLGDEFFFWDLAL